MKDSLFPSGSHWGLAQLQRLRFHLQPEFQPLQDLQWKNALSQDSLNVLQGIEREFGLEESEWKDKIVPGQYEDFYGYLTEMLPRNQEKHLTPRNPALRSNTHLPSSSTRSSSSPWSAASTIKTVPLSLQKTPTKFVMATTASPETLSEPDEEVLPTPAAKRQREDSGSTNLPPKTSKTSSDTSYVPLRDSDLRSSQTDSTFLSSEHSTSDSEALSDGDRAETGVTFLMQSMLNRICKAQGDSNDYSFSIENDVETLAIPICGSFPTTKPDLLVRMQHGRKSYPILDLEVNRFPLNQGHPLISPL
jgi:hypothetical protein